MVTLTSWLSERYFATSSSPSPLGMYLILDPPKTYPPLPLGGGYDSPANSYLYHFGPLSSRNTPYTSGSTTLDRTLEEKHGYQSTYSRPPPKMWLDPSFGREGISFSTTPNLRGLFWQNVPASQKLFTPSPRAPP